ncbi:MmyB family transcriptional regulator [Streptomyces goshikiensis]|uniref:MmyB family transcriptional regulator n=1 Tax=Streptomyces goshikiensis TaxID=1942 RepID=UPI002ADF2D7B|nr:hypothetical protein [Streptomyces goshikiensis]
MKSPSSPESASTATSAWNEAAPKASPKPSWTPSPVPCTWTTPNAPTSSTSPSPPPLPGPAANDPSPRNESAPALYRALDALSVPAVVQGRRLDVVAANPLGCAQLADFASRPHRDRNFARSVFLDQAALSLSTDWERAARDTAASLRLYAGRHADDPQLTELIGSDTFRRLWAGHDVRAPTNGHQAPAPPARRRPHPTTSLSARHFPDSPRTAPTRLSSTGPLPHRGPRLSCNTWQRPAAAGDSVACTPAPWRLLAWRARRRTALAVVAAAS